MKRIVILISGRGSNMLALIKACLSGLCPAKIVGIFSDRQSATGLQVAAIYGFKTELVDFKQAGNLTNFEYELDKQISTLKVDLIILAGFMRVLSSTFVARYEGRMINIHPSLLPSFPGLNTHQRALAEGVKWHGATVHFVTAQLDQGPIIAQAAVPVLVNDTIKTLSERVLKAEHQLLSQTLSWLVKDKVKWVNDANGSFITYSKDISQQHIAFLGTC